MSTGSCDSRDHQPAPPWGPSRQVQGCLSKKRGAEHYAQPFQPCESLFNRLRAIQHSQGWKHMASEAQIKDGMGKTFLHNAESIFIKKHLKMQGLINKLLPTTGTFTPCTFWLYDHRMFYLFAFLSSDVLRFWEKTPNRPKAVFQVCKYHRQKRAGKPEEEFMRVPISNEQLTKTNFNLWF